MDLWEAVLGRSAWADMMEDSDTSIAIWEMGRTPPCGPNRGHERMNVAWFYETAPKPDFLLFNQPTLGQRAINRGASRASYG